MSHVIAQVRFDLLVDSLAIFTQSSDAERHRQGLVRFKGILAISAPAHARIDRPLAHSLGKSATAFVCRCAFCASVRFLCLQEIVDVLRTDEELAERVKGFAPFLTNLEAILALKVRRCFGRCCC